MYFLPTSLIWTGFEQIPDISTLYQQFIPIYSPQISLEQQFKNPEKHSVHCFDTLLSLNSPQDVISEKSKELPQQVVETPTENKFQLKKQSQKIRQQRNKLRNIVPNIVHQVFCFINRQKRSIKVVKKFLKIKGQESPEWFSFQRFYFYHRLIKEKINNYLNFNSLKMLNCFQDPQFQVYGQQEQVNFIRMNRLLVKYFLEHEFEAILLTSYRMNHQTRIWNMETKRKLIMQLPQIFSTF